MHFNNKPVATTFNCQELIPSKSENSKKFDTPLIPLTLTPKIMNSVQNSLANFYRIKKKKKLCFETLVKFRKGRIQVKPTTMVTI